jgi:hypothetical protein
MINKAATFNLSYPASISAVKKFGPENWADNFFMPVSRSTYIEIRNEICMAYGKSLKCLSPSSEPYWSWMANYKITFQVAEYIYTALFLKKLREEGFESIDTSSDMKIEDAEKKLPELLVFPAISDKLDMPHLLLEKWRAVRTNWGRCSFLKYLLPSVFHSDLYVLGGRGEGELGAYIEELRTEPVNLRPDLYIKGNHSGNFISESESACGLFKNEIAAILEKYKINLPAGYYQELAKYISDCSMLISGTRKNICGWARLELIINPVSNLKHRIFTAAWRLSGGSATGISHGNPYIYGTIHPDMGNGANSILDKFVTMSSEEKNLFEWSRNNSGTGLRAQLEIHVCKNTIYRKRFEIFNRGAIPKTIKKVMLMGTPFNNALHLPHRLYLMLMEVELISMLINSNYQVIYKAHPDTLKETEELFSGSGCERVTDKFENVWNDCDCIIFPSVFTTAFGLSLMTPKHVIAFSWIDQSNWRMESLDKLKKRATVIEVEIDGNGKPSFDRSRLHRALASPIEFDHSIIHEFALK